MLAEQKKGRLFLTLTFQESYNNENLWQRQMKGKKSNQSSRKTMELTIGGHSDHFCVLSHQSALRTTLPEAFGSRLFERHQFFATYSFAAIGSFALSHIELLQRSLTILLPFFPLKGQFLLLHLIRFTCCFHLFSSSTQLFILFATHSLIGRYLQK